jgi:hypothetical protein
VSTDVSEEHIASIFRIEEISSARNQQASRWQADLCSSEDRLTFNGLHGVKSKKRYSSSSVFLFGWFDSFGVVCSGLGDETEGEIGGRKEEDEEESIRIRRRKIWTSKRKAKGDYERERRRSW